MNEAKNWDSSRQDDYHVHVMFSIMEINTVMNAVKNKAQGDIM